MLSAQLLAEANRTPMKEIVVVDIDGTLALIEHRLHYIQQEEPDWDTFFKACVDDVPNEPIIKLVDALHCLGYHILLATTRPENVRVETVEWLRQVGLAYDRLLMREVDDVVEDDEVKRRWLENDTINEDQVLFVIDDRQKVVDMWREQGLVCLQPRPGDF